MGVIYNRTADLLNLQIAVFVVIRQPLQFRVTRKGDGNGVVRTLDDPIHLTLAFHHLHLGLRRSPTPLVQTYDVARPGIAQNDLTCHLCLTIRTRLLNHFIEGHVKQYRLRRVASRGQVTTAALFEPSVCSHL